MTPEPTGVMLDEEGFSYHYVDVGHGSPLVLLHGGGPGVTAWNTYAQNADVLAATYRLIMIDQPGYGGSAQNPEFQGSYWHYSARVVALVLDRLGLTKVGLVAHSLGGGTAIRFCLDYPEKVEKLTLVAAAGMGQPSISPVPTEGGRLLRMTLSAAEARNEDATSHYLRDFLSAQLADQNYFSEESFRERLASAMSEPSSSNVRRALARVDPTLSSQLDKLVCRSLLIWGKEDRVMPLEIAIRALGQIRDSILSVFSSCGHLPQLERARDFERQVIAFNST